MGRGRTSRLFDRAEGGTDQMQWVTALKYVEVNEHT